MSRYSCLQILFVCMLNTGCPSCIGCAGACGALTCPAHVHWKVHRCTAKLLNSSLNQVWSYAAHHFRHGARAWPYLRDGTDQPPTILVHHRNCPVFCVCFWFQLSDVTCVWPWNFLSWVAKYSTEFPTNLRFFVGRVCGRFCPFVLVLL